MPAGRRAHVLGKIDSLATDPFAAPNVRKLIGRPGYRLRVGDWRVIYQIDGARWVKLVLAIAPRGGIYQ